MCRRRRDVMAADPKPRPSPRGTRRASSGGATTTSTSGPTDSGSYPLPPAATSTSSSSSAASKASSSPSLAALRDSLPEPPALFSFSEIAAATNNFLSKRLSSSSSSSWRCSLRGRDAVVFQRPFRGSDPAALPARLAALGRSHHASLVRLLGASLAGDQIYLAYEFTAGASLAECLRNPRNPNFTPLSSWVARMQVAADLAQGLEYIHHHASATGGDSPEDRRRRRSRPRGTVHNRITSSTVIVTEPGFRAKICHFGAADLAGEIPAAEVEDEEEIKTHTTNEIEIEIEKSPSSSKMRRSDSRKMRIEGTRGYMAPELLAGGRISRRSDVYAFGVVLLELLSGDEPLRYRFDKQTEDFERASLIETAREAIGNAAEADEESVPGAGAGAGSGGGTAAKAEERRGRVRRWMDRRLKDSYPVEAAERLMRVALRCVEAEPAARPDMTWVAGRVSKLFIDAKAWAERVKHPTDFSVSMAPR